MAASREDWERVGPLLVERREQIDRRYANRRTFSDETGVNWRTLYDAEYGKRANFGRSTIRAFEGAYRLVPGSLERSLAGGPLEPADALRAEPGTHPDFTFPEPSETARLLFPGDLVKQRIWDLPDVDEDTRAAMVGVIDERRRRSRGEDGDLSSGIALTGFPHLREIPRQRPGAAC